MSSEFSVGLESQKLFPFFPSGSGLPLVDYFQNYGNPNSMLSNIYFRIAYEFKKKYPGQRNAVKMTFDFHFSPPNTVIENHKLR